MPPRGRAFVLSSLNIQSTTAHMQAEQDYEKNSSTLQSAHPDSLHDKLFVSATPACQDAIRLTSVQDCFHDFEFRLRRGKESQGAEPVTDSGSVSRSTSINKMLT